jgi:hypothetical protein
MSKRQPRPWAAADIELLRQRFADSSTKDLAAALGRTYTTVAQKAAKLGLKKSDAYLASKQAGRFAGRHGTTSRFKPGLTPWNKGLKGVVGVQEACRATQFKPGRQPSEARNYKPIGSLRICRDGYVERKVTDDQSVYPARRWVAVHRLVWIAAHVEIPAGHIVRFKRGMHTTVVEEITTERLECVSRAEHMRTHTYHQYGPEIAGLVQLRGAVTRQINKRAKEAAEA